MTYQKAISAIMDACNWNGSGQYTSDELTEAKRIVCEATEKQIPQKPNLQGDGYADGELVYDYAECPVCGNDDFEEDTNDWGCKYCPDCGQALDWSDTE